MKTIYNPAKTICILMLSGLSTTLAAQDVKVGQQQPRQQPQQQSVESSALNREMTLEREYDPSVQSDANKINILPSVSEPSVSKMPVSYEFLSLPLELDNTIELLPPARIQADIKYNPRRGYLNVGGGTYMNINGDAGCHILSDEKNQLNIFLSHRSSDTELKYTEGGLIGDMQAKVKINDNTGGLNLKHELDNLTVRMGAKFVYSAFNYFGMTSSSAYTNWPSPVADTFTDQVSQQITANVGVTSKNMQGTGYTFDADYTQFSYKYAGDKNLKGMTEHSAGVKMKYYNDFIADQQLGVTAKFNYLFYSLPEPLLAPLEGHAELTLTPYYQMDGELGILRAGVNVMYVTSAVESAKIFASPNVEYTYNLGYNSTAYANAGGGIHSNSAFLLSRENRYVDPYMNARPSRTWLDAVVGLRSGYMPGLWANVFAGYKMTDDDYFFVPYLTDKGFANVSRVLSQNSRLIRGGLELKYSYLQYADLGLKAVYNVWNADIVPYGRPTTELTLNIGAHPIKKLTVDVDYRMGAGRKVLLYGASEDMKNINELNLSATYALNNTLGFYVKANNVLSEQYELVYGYPLQGVSVMGGVNFNF